MKFNDENRFSTVADLTYDDLKSLLFTLRDIDKSDVDIDMKNNAVVTNIDRFFPDVTMDQYLSLTYLCQRILEDSSDELEFNDFKEKNMTLKIDKFGMSEPNPRRVWEGRLSALDSIFEMAEKMKDDDDTPFKIHLQAYNAKTLDCLKKMVKCDPYIYNRKLMLEKMASLGMTNKAVCEYENILRKHGCDMSVMNKMIQYIKTKTYNNIHIFFNHFLERLDLLKADDCLENESCREFLENIKKLSKKD